MAVWAIAGPGASQSRRSAMACWPAGSASSGRACCSLPLLVLLVVLLTLPVVVVAIQRWKPSEGWLSTRREGPDERLVVLGGSVHGRRVPSARDEQNAEDRRTGRMTSRGH